MREYRQHAHIAIDQCQLWQWVPHGDGLYHRQCTSVATMDSIVPGRIRLRVCEACYKRRQEDTDK